MSIRKQLHVNSHSTIDQSLIPSLTESQVRSYEWFESEGIRELLDEIFPISDMTGTRFDLVYGNQGLSPDEITNEPEFEFREPRYDEAKCRSEGLTYASPLYVRVRLILKESGGEEREQLISFGDIPKMTDRGTFIINGAERVVVSQIVRSPGAYFNTVRDSFSGRTYSTLKVIPYRGAWIEAETNSNGTIAIKVDRKRKLPITTLLVALGMKKSEIIKEFAEVDKQSGYIEETLKRSGITAEKDTTKSTEKKALAEIYKRLRPNEPVITDMERAREIIESTFFNPRKYDFGKVGRFKLNNKLGVNRTERTLTMGDIKDMIRLMIQINNNDVQMDDDVDHIGNRRVRGAGELLQNQLRGGMLRMERTIIDRMATTNMRLGTGEQEAPPSPAAFINNRPIVTVARNFFIGSQLSQFMDQTNPLAELTHKRRISAMGPGGLTRERASFDVRDVHYSHYGRLCSIETPEGPNIGLLSSLATFARIDDYGFINSPYIRVLHSIAANDRDIVGRKIVGDLVDDKGKKILDDGTRVTQKIYDDQLKNLSGIEVPVKPYASNKQEDIIYISADVEEQYRIIQATTPMDNNRTLMVDRVQVRHADDFTLLDTSEVDIIEYSPMQMVSVTTSLIPFLEHDDANRALMGSNMQRQAVPLIKPTAPMIGTGMESSVAKNSGQVVYSATDGIVTSASSDKIQVMDNNGENHDYELVKFVRSNQGTCVNQRPIVNVGQIVNGPERNSDGHIIKEGSVLADSYAFDKGELALGQNLLVGFMSWGGYNYEDAIILSEDLVRDDRFTSVHIEMHESEARETKLGEEEITRDIPNIDKNRLNDLDEDGIIREGAWVEPNDILVGKISPKGETELTAEEKLLWAIFGEKARDVKDSSLRLPHGQRGRVIKVSVLTRENNHKLAAGVVKVVRVWIAHSRKIQVGDKMAGRHGNKGVISRILPREDMPFLADGRRLDIVLNPIGVPSRMNLGQLLETHLGFIADTFGDTFRMTVFDSISQDELEDHQARKWFVEKSGALDKTKLGDTDVDHAKFDAWLKERGYDGEHIWSTAPSRVGEARRACLKLWLEEQGVEGLDDLKSNELIDKARETERQRNLCSPISGKSILFDGRTGDPFMQAVTVGCIYMMKLIHLSEDKIHARSTGPYSLITQQPLGGKAQFGGQRFGEMEVWALQAYSAAYTLQEMLTVKSDDVQGRNKSYEAIATGKYVDREGLPESFHVLVKEIQSLGLSVELLNQSPEEAREIDHDEGLAIEGDETFDLESDDLLSLDVDSFADIGTGDDDSENTDDNTNGAE